MLFYASIAARLVVKHLITTTHHTYTNGQVERSNKTIVVALRHYISEHQIDWDQYLQLLSYEFNVEVHRENGPTLFSLVQFCQPPGPTTTNPASAT